jgi:RNA polymerase-binding transcription factor DksA
MNNEQYRRRLLDLEKELSARINREAQLGRDQFHDVAGDTADASVADADAAEDFAEVDRDSTMLREVRDALGRLDAGTFGRCTVDGGPIEPARLAAAPWSRYCLKHQQAREEGSPRPPTL